MPLVIATYVIVLVFVVAGLHFLLTTGEGE